MKALWNDQVIAESDNTIIIEGNHYFPIESVKKEFLRISETSTICHWKGKASYYSLDVGGAKNENAAWYYKEPSKPAEGIKDRIAFWRGVEVVK
ncbi:DUF427 domain-containing protein [Bacteroidota bacterium]